MKVVVRNELESDYRVVEEITKLAFWNIHCPGCDEHYLAHTMRSHPDFVASLDFVLVLDGRVIGNIMYAKARLDDGQGGGMDVVMFGPVSIHPDFQGKGYGGTLIRHSIQKAKESGYPAIVIYGNPGNYVKYGFKSCIRYDICAADGEYPTGMLVLELEKGRLGDVRRTFVESPAYSVDPAGFDEFDRGFEPMEKLETDRQEEFFILSNSRVRKNAVS